MTDDCGGRSETLLLTAVWCRRVDGGGLEGGSNVFGVVFSWALWDNKEAMDESESFVNRAFEGTLSNERTGVVYRYMVDALDGFCEWISLGYAPLEGFIPNDPPNMSL